MHRILVVDDDRMNQLLAKKFLSAYYELDSVNSGAKVFSYLETRIPDLILLDLMMPEMDGFEVMRRLQADARTKDIPIIFLTADRSEKVEEACFKAGCADFISKPFLPAVMVERVKRTLELEDYRRHMEQCVSEQLNKLTRIQNTMILTLANIIDRRDGTTGGHIRRSSAYIRFLLDSLRKMGYAPEQLTAEYCEQIVGAAPMYDIGKITIPDSILRKPGKLTAEEYDIVKGHTTAGGEIILESMEGMVDETFVKTASDMARFHHERWDGSGYPTGLKAEQIPLCARITAIADVFDALVSKTYYSGELTAEAAMDVLLDEKEKFDRTILDAFVHDRKALSDLVRQLKEG